MQIKKKKKKTVINFPNGKSITRYFKKNAQTWIITIDKKEIENIFKTKLRKYFKSLIKHNHSEGSDNEIGFFHKILGAIPEDVLEDIKGFELVGQTYGKAEDNKDISRRCDVIMGTNKYLELKAHDTGLGETYGLHKQLPFYNVAKLQELNKDIDPDDVSFVFVHISSLKILDILMGKKVKLKDKKDVYKKIENLIGKELLEKYFKRQSKRAKKDKDYKTKKAKKYGERELLNDIQRVIKKRKKEKKFSKTNRESVDKLEIVFFFNGSLTISNIIGNDYFFAVKDSIKTSSFKDFYGYILNNSYAFTKPFKHSDKGRYKKILTNKEIHNKLEEIRNNFKVAINKK